MSEPQVTPNFREVGECGCGCGAFGTLKRPSRDGTRCVARECKCPRCRGRNNRTKGDRKALKARKALNIQGVNSRHEELFGGHLRVEVKAGAQIKPAVTAFNRCLAQSEVSRSHGDNRPFAAIFMPDGASDGVVAFKLSDALDAATAILENFGGGA